LLTNQGRTNHLSLTAKTLGVYTCFACLKLFSSWVYFKLLPAAAQFSVLHQIMKKKRSGHYCRICGRSRPNEKFSGKGHRNHICKECARKPKNERDEIDQTEEIFSFLSQSHISKKNVERLTVLAESENEKISELAGIVLEVAKVKPYKKRRLKVLARERRDLLEKLDETGLIFAHH